MAERYVVIEDLLESDPDADADPVTPNSNFGTYTNFVNLMDISALGSWHAYLAAQT